MASPATQTVRELLRHRDYVKLIDLCLEEPRYWKALRFCAYDADEEVFWPAIEATGQLMQRHWEASRQERVREYVRSLLWSLNDESGGIGWNAPQTIAEIIARIPELFEPYASMMISQTIPEPPLVPNGLWAIGRLGAAACETVAFFWEAIREAWLEAVEPQTLGVGCWAMGRVRFAPSLASLQSFTRRPESAKIYTDGRFHCQSLGEWADQAANLIPVEEKEAT